MVSIYRFVAFSLVRMTFSNSDLMRLIQQMKLQGANDIGAPGKSDLLKATELGKGLRKLKAPFLVSSRKNLHYSGYWQLLKRPHIC
jgi:hypothetical protein